MGNCNGVNIKVICGDGGGGGGSGSFTVPYGDRILWKANGNNDLDNPQTGDWQIIITADGKLSRENYNGTAFEVVSQDDPIV